MCFPSQKDRAVLCIEAAFTRRVPKPRFIFHLWFHPTTVGPVATEPEVACHPVFGLTGYLVLGGQQDGIVYANGEALGCGPPGGPQSLAVGVLTTDTEHRGIVHANGEALGCGPPGVCSMDQVKQKKSGAWDAVTVTEWLDCTLRSSVSRLPSFHPPRTTRWGICELRRCVVRWCPV